MDIQCHRAVAVDMNGHQAVAVISNGHQAVAVIRMSLSSMPQCVEYHTMYICYVIGSVAESMVDAMNHGDEDRSKSMFDILMRFMKEPENGGKFELNFNNPKETPVKPPSFT